MFLPSASNSLREFTFEVVSMGGQRYLERGAQMEVTLEVAVQMPGRVVVGDQV